MAKTFTWMSSATGRFFPKLQLHTYEFTALWSNLAGSPKQNYPVGQGLESFAGDVAWTNSVNIPPVFSHIHYAFLKINL